MWYLPEKGGQGRGVVHIYALYTVQAYNVLQEWFLFFSAGKRKETLL